MAPNLLALPAGCAFSERCPRRTARCEQRPALERRAAGHVVRCFHPGQEALQ